MPLIPHQLQQQLLPTHLEQFMYNQLLQYTHNQYKVHIQADTPNKLDMYNQLLQQDTLNPPTHNNPLKDTPQQLPQDMPQQLQQDMLQQPQQDMPQQRQQDTPHLNNQDMPLQPNQAMPLLLKQDTLNSGIPHQLPLILSTLNLKSPNKYIYIYVIMLFIMY